MPRDTALDLAELVSDLPRVRVGTDLIVAVVDQLQRDDPTYQRELKQLKVLGSARSRVEMLASPTEADCLAGAGWMPSEDARRLRG